MPRIHYLSDQKTVEVLNGHSILESSLRAGIPHAHACGGYARCSTCRVLILDGLDRCTARTPVEQRLADRLHFTPDIRLACQTKITGDVKLRRLVLDDEDIRLTSQLQTEVLSGFAGEEKQVAILFANLRGFTHFTEQHLPYDVVHVLNRYFYEMGQVINANGGYIDNYMGDGLMALFGVDDPVDATFRAIRAGLEMIEAMQRLNPYLTAVYRTQFDLGIGIHYGEVVVGTIGAAPRKKETAIGDAVTLASRIESANKMVDTHLLISEDAYDQVAGRVKLGKNVSIELKGKQGRYALSEVVNFTPSSEKSSNTPPSTYRPPPTSPLLKNQRPTLVAALGGLLLGAFIVGFATQLFSGNIFLIYAFVIMGFIGAPLMFWGLIR